MEIFKQIIAKEELFNLFRILKLVEKNGDFLAGQLVGSHITGCSGISLS